jgi:hypothetical protein
MPSKGRFSVRLINPENRFFMIQRNGQEHSRSRCALEAIQVPFMGSTETVRPSVPGPCYGSGHGA